MTTEGRVRLSLGSGLVQTSQWQPIIGTPALVPVPRNSRSIWPGMGWVLLVRHLVVIRGRNQSAKDAKGREVLFVLFFSFFSSRTFASFADHFFPRAAKDLS